MIALELMRISELPRLNINGVVRNFVQMPLGKDGRDKAGAKSFDSRYNYLYIVDEEGIGWMGLVTPSNIRALSNAEYLQRSYFIPIKGRGHGYDSPTVTIDGYELHTYPSWFKPSDLTGNDWRVWLEEHKEFDRCNKIQYYQDFYADIYPTSNRREVRKKREELVRWKQELDRLQNEKLKPFIKLKLTF